MIDRDYLLAVLHGTQDMSDAALEAVGDDGLYASARNLGYDLDDVVDFCIGYMAANLEDLIEVADGPQAITSMLSRMFEIGLIAGRDEAHDPRKARR